MHDENDEAIPLTGADTAVPMAEPIDTQVPVPDEGSPGSPVPVHPAPVHLPPLRPCKIDVKEGCYRVAYTPNASSSIIQTFFYGTIRVDKRGGSGPTTVSGDLYRFVHIQSPIGPLPATALFSAIAAPA